MIRRAGLPTARQMARENLFPPHACCSVCGWSDPLALEEDTDPLLCYQCHRGKDWEKHHIAGEANYPHLVVYVPANLHRVLSDWQYDWPDEVRPNHGHRELTPQIACLLGIADFLLLAVDCAQETEMACTVLWSCAEQRDLSASEASQASRFAARALCRTYLLTQERKARVSDGA